MSWFPPPPPFVGGAQPYQPVRLPADQVAHEFDNPPFAHGGTLARTLAIVSMWQPMWQASPWTYGFAGDSQPYAPLRMSVGIPGQSVDRPPVVQAGRTAAQMAIAAANAQPGWKSGPWVYSFVGDSQPYAPLRMSVGIPGQSIDKPPFSRRLQLEQLAAITASWQPPPPAPWVPSLTPGYSIKFTLTFSQLLILG